MPYRNIHWIKLEKRLLNDHRFYTLSANGQRIYVKLLMLAGQTNNKVPKNHSILASSLREPLEPIEIGKCLEEIKGNFPKFKETKHYYHFIGFSSRHNQVIPGISPGSPQAIVDKRREEEIREDKRRTDVMLNLFKEKHKELTGVPYIPNYGKDRILLKEFLEFEEKDMVSLINEFFDSSKDSSVWWADKLSIGVFKVVVPKLLGRLRKR